MPYRANHVLSRCVLAQWADQAGQVCVVTPPNLIARRRRPEKVAYRHNFWGHHLGVRAGAERFFAEIENDVAKLLPEFRDRWPFVFGEDDWCTTACLLAVHLWRNPAGRQRLDAIQRLALANQLPRLERQFSSEAINAFLAHVTSDGFRADTMIRNLRQAVSLLGSMHWALLEFDERLLATSDQPLSIAPIVRPGESGNVGAFLDRPLLECEEIRFPVGPRHALLLTWHDGLADGTVIRADDGIAAQLNRAVVGQADEQWFYHPDRRPTTLIPRNLGDASCSAIGRTLIPGYGWHAAIASDRRARAATILRQPDHGAADIRVAKRQLRAA